MSRHILHYNCTGSQKMLEGLGIIFIIRILLKYHATKLSHEKRPELLKRELGLGRAGLRVSASVAAKGQRVKESKGRD